QNDEKQKTAERRPGKVRTFHSAVYWQTIICPRRVVGRDAPMPGGRPPHTTCRFMESLLWLLRMHWDHEPRRGGRRRASVLDCGSPLPLLRPRTRSESARGLAHSKTS